MTTLKIHCLLDVLARARTTVIDTEQTTEEVPLTAITA
jgi:hypothetical protein